MNKTMGNLRNQARRVRLLPGRLRETLALTHRFDELQAHTARLESHCDELRARCSDLEQRLLLLQSQHLHARDLVDLLKSRVELGPEPFRAFQEWKAAHPIPDEPLVSVCVATYNRAGLLVERCLASIRAQTYRRLDVVVVGDG
jgi:predicted nuclease with TOPRIM domain